MHATWIVVMYPSAIKPRVAFPRNCVGNEAVAAEISSDRALGCEAKEKSRVWAVFRTLERLSVILLLSLVRLRRRIPSQHHAQKHRRKSICNSRSVRPAATVPELTDLLSTPDYCLPASTDTQDLLTGLLTSFPSAGATAHIGWVIEPRDPTEGHDLQGGGRLCHRFQA